MKVTHKHEILTQGWQYSGDLKPFLDFCPAVWNGFGSQTQHDESMKCNFLQDALANSVVLRQIFTYLDDDDLESCCNVCQDWRTVADPLVVTHFYIELGRIDDSHNPVHLDNSMYNLTVREGARYKRKSFTQRADFGVTQILEVILTQKVSISLTLTKVDDIQDDKVMDFLSKIGPQVVDLDLSEIDQQSMSVADFCKLLLQEFPNLNKLHCCNFGRSLQDQLFNDFKTYLPQNKHKRLRKIVFGYPQYTPSFVETILKICPNLENIEDFPLRVINAIVVAQKGPVLKSLLKKCYTDSYFHEMGETVVTAYEKLAHLQPKLSSLVFSSVDFDTENDFESVKPFLFSVLQSSHASLESLIIAPLISDEVQNLPTLKGLKELEILDPDDDGVFFTPEMQVKEIFPNVCKFGSSYHTWDEAFIERHLPENVICPWGTQIMELNVNDLAVSAIPLVQRRFPSIQKSELKNSEVDLPNILLELSRFWPQLKSLTISCDESGFRQMCFIYGTTVRLDHAFTGLPDEVIDQLQDPSRKKDFTDEEIQGFKDRSIICKLKELTELKIFLGECEHACENWKMETRTYAHAYMRLTPVANEFGFSLLPELAVTLVAEECVRFAKGMKRDLEALAACSNIEIVSAKNGYPYVF